MPSILNKHCPRHGIYQGKSCPHCKALRNKAYDKNIRNKEASKFYHSREWKSIRNIALSRNPFCVKCGRAADMVDHIKAIKDGGSKFDLNNLQSMCNSCHNSKEMLAGNRW